MHDDQSSDQCQPSADSLAELIDRRSKPERRSGGDRRHGRERRHTDDRRESSNPELLLAALEKRIAAAIKQNGGRLEDSGSGWDKLIVPFR